MTRANVVGGDIKRLRENCGLTQEQLGRKIGCGAANISHMEKGTTPSLEQYEKMAPVFKKHPLELIWGLPPEACKVADQIAALRPDRRPAAARLFQLAMEMAEVVSKWQAGPTK